MFGWILSTTVLIAIIFPVRCLLRNKMDPRLTYVLWLVVALRALIPGTLFASPVSVSGLAENSGLAEVMEEVRYTREYKTTYGTAGDSFGKEGSPAYEDSLWGQEANWFGYQGVTDVHIVETEEVSAAEAGGNPQSDSAYTRLKLEITRDRFFTLRVIWCIGMAGMALWFLFANLRLRLRLRRTSLPAQADSSLPVRVMPSLVSPCLCGLFRPTIYITADCLTDETRLRHVLTHEQTHFFHKDHWWAVVRCVCLIVQWFNPLVWLAAWLSRQDCELACDASVIKRLGEDQRLSYGKTLVDMIASTRTPSALLQTATTMTGGKKSITQRIRLIAKRPKMTAVTLVSVLLISALAVGCTFGGAGDTEAPNDPPNLSDSPVLPSEEPEPPVTDPPAISSEEPEPSAFLPADLSAVDLAQSVYQSIVGDHNSRDFYMVVYDNRAGHGNTTTRIHMTGENSWNLPDSIGKYAFPNPDNASRYEWAYASSDGWDANFGLSLSSADGETWLYCWEDTDRVRLHADGQDFFLTATVPEGRSSASALFNVLLWAADDALVHEAYNIVIDGSFSDYSMVAEEYARRFAANLNNLPLWAPSKPERTVYRYSGVSQAYFGEGTENFCGFFGLYFSPEMGMSDWQAGSGMDEETEGEYTGWWKWGIGADFARNSDGDWVCTGTYTGGESLTFPTRLEESSLEQMVYYFYHTTPGHNHDYLIPYYICQQPVSALDELNRLLGEVSVPHELCAALGAFLRDYGDYEDIQLTYEVLSGGLESKFRPYLDEGYTGVPE